MNISSFSNNISSADKNFIQDKVTLFNQLYSGYCPEYHSFKLGEKRKEYKIIPLNMTKQIGEDNASLIVNENLSFNIQDKQVKTFLMGEDENGRSGELGRINFWGKVIELTEKLYSYSGSALLILLPTCFNEGKQAANCSLNFKYLTSLDFFISIDGNTVYFDSDEKRDDDTFKLFQIINKRSIFLDNSLIIFLRKVDLFQR
ncbi:MAG: hypothetical protein LBF97_01320 [Elusimicrobiota bacterium]|jgi:hypothetical protein|nr:hypothetical protein [Elusimicrobiota bacterium]